MEEINMECVTVETKLVETKSGRKSEKNLQPNKKPSKAA